MNSEKTNEPAKRIYGESELDSFRKSLAYKKLHHVMSFILDKVTATKVPNNQLCPTIVTRNSNATVESLSSPESEQEYTATGNTKLVIDILGEFNKLIDETPPLKGPRRFGNMACRDWHIKVNAKSLDLLGQLSNKSQYKVELNHYLTNSFGSAVRLDYGSGHELSFVAFVGGLFEQNVLDKDISGENLLALFSKYYDLVRRLILDYSLEPAGSHGVWGLDDHFHFIYILGAAEFNSRNKTGKNAPFQYVPPVSQILSAHTINTYKTSNLYVNAIAFIFKLKSGPFHEHSPVLYDIHKSVTLWGKVETGLLKMYEVEVFGKFPVVQHFWFGEELYPWVDADSLRPLPMKSADEMDDNAEKTGENIPGLINGLHGTRTTNDNIAITGAPWASQTSARTVPVRGAWGVGRNTASSIRGPSNPRDRI